MSASENRKSALAVVLTAPFVPMLFQGEEYGASTPFQYFTHHEDPELGEQVSEGRRSEFEAFGWNPEDIPDPQDPARLNARNSIGVKSTPNRTHLCCGGCAALLLCGGVRRTLRMDGWTRSRSTTMRLRSGW